MTAPDWLTELRRLVEAATPGPWSHDLDCFDPDLSSPISACVAAAAGGMLFVAETSLTGASSDGWQAARTSQPWWDAAFIAGARDAVPRLLEIIAAADAVAKAGRAYWLAHDDVELAQLDRVGWARHVTDAAAIMSDALKHYEEARK